MYRVVADKMMERTALALLAFGATPQLVQAGGLSSCPCLTSYPDGVTVNSDGQPTVTIEGVRTSCSQELVCRRRLDAVRSARAGGYVVPNELRAEQLRSPLDQLGAILCRRGWQTAAWPARLVQPGEPVVLRRHRLLQRRAGKLHDVLAQFVLPWRVHVLLVRHLRWRAQHIRCLGQLNHRMHHG